MPDQQHEELRERITHLEKRVHELEQKLNAKAVKTDLAGSYQSQKTTDKESKGSRARSRLEEVQFDEQWLNRIGIGLLLIGVAFLFKYSIDQGWLIPSVRSAIGLGIGGLLFGSGLGMDEQMNPFRQLLLGGGIAVFYITGFATFQLYSFVPDVLIWIFMVVVTLLALSLSLQQDEAVLSVTGTLGALGTPFMLYSGAGRVGTLVIYTTLVLATAAIIYYQKGWKSLLWSMLIGGFCVMAVGVITSVFDEQSLSLVDHWILQAGMGVWAIATWGTAMFYALSNQEKKPSSTIHLSIFWVPFWLLPLMGMHWDLSEEGAALVAFGWAAIGIAGYPLLKRQGSPSLAFSHGFMALIMATIGGVLFFDGTALFILLAIEAVMLRYLAAYTRDSKLNISAHFLFFIVVIWVTNSFYLPVGANESVVTVESFSQLIFIASGGTLIPYWLVRTDFKQLYRILSHLLLLCWIYQTFSYFSNGQAWVTVVWGLYAIGLLIAGFTRFGKKVRLVGMGTIFLVVGKLFLVDLSQLPALWRILLFIGFGSALILLGYYLQSKWSRTKSEI